MPERETQRAREERERQTKSESERDRDKERHKARERERGRERERVIRVIGGAGWMGQSTHRSLLCNKAELRDEAGDLCFFSLVEQLSEAEKATFCDLILYQSIKSGQHDEQKMPVWDEVFNAMGVRLGSGRTCPATGCTFGLHFERPLCSLGGSRPSSLFFLPHEAPRFQKQVHHWPYVNSKHQRLSMPESRVNCIA